MFSLNLLLLGLSLGFKDLFMVGDNVNFLFFYLFYPNPLLRVRLLLYRENLGHSKAVLRISMSYNAWNWSKSLCAGGCGVVVWWVTSTYNSVHLRFTLNNIKCFSATYT